MIVVDASVNLEVLIRTSLAAVAEKWLFGPDEMPRAPHLLDLEVTHAVRRYTARGVIDPVLGRAVLADLADFRLPRHPHHFLLSRVWELRQNFTAYDAVYVALAEALDATLLTGDRRLAGAMRGSS